MNISVIFSTYNRPQTLLRTLSNFCLLNDENLSWEIIAVDNGNDPEIKKIILSSANQLPIKYFRESRRGKNFALNTGISIAMGELFIFTDDDVLADCNWLQEMWNGTNRWQDFSVFGGRILPDFPEGRIPLPKNHFFYNGSYVIADWDIDEGIYNADLVWGPNMAIRSEIFKKGWRFNTKIGPSGNNYIMGSETELTLKLNESGFKSIYLPNSLVYHQIRPEQLKPKWLYQRAYKWGRNQAILSQKPDVPFFLSAPRYLFRQLFEILFKRIIYFCNFEKRIDLGIVYWKTRGMIYQYKNMQQ